MRPSSQLTCSFASIVTINVLDRVHDQSTRLQASLRPNFFICSNVMFVTIGRRSCWVRHLATGLRSCSTTELKCSFAVMVVIGLALPVHHGHDWTEQQLVMSCCDGLTDRRASIKEMGQLEHSRASSLSKLHECNSASCVVFFFWYELEKRM